MLWLCADAVGEIQSNVDELNKRVSRLSDMTDNLINKLIGFGFDLLVAILIFIAGKFVLKLLREIFKNIMSKSNVDIGVIKFGDSIIRAIGYVIILIIICGQIGIQTTSFITLLGTAGLSIGFALEGCLSNFAGGVLILVTKPFVVGDYIMINSSADNVE